MRNADVVYMEFGSHLYGLDTPLSDIDYKGIYLPTLQELLLSRVQHSYKDSTGPKDDKNRPGDVDREVMSLPYFIEKAIKGDMVAIDMLHCNEPMINSPIWESLIRNRSRFYTRNLKGFRGYVNRQAAMYGIRGSRLGDVRAAIDVLNRLSNIPAKGELTLSQVWDFLYEGEHVRKIRKTDNQNRAMDFYEVNGKKHPSHMRISEASGQMLAMYTQYGAKAKAAEKNEGIDWKALSHALRAAYQLRDIYLEGDYQYPLHENDYLREVKAGELNFIDDVAPTLEALVEEVEALAEQSDLPEKVEETFWDGWLIGTYVSNFGIRIS